MSNKETAIAIVVALVAWLWFMACVWLGLVPVVEAFGGPKLPVVPTALTLWFLWFLLIPFKINRK